MENSNKELLRVSAFGFIILTFMLVSLMTFYSYQQQKGEYQKQAQGLYQSIVDTALINKVILEGFTSIADEVDEFPYFETLSRYTEQVKKDYPHIYMLELQQRITSEQRASFEQSYQQAGFNYFQVRSFSYETDRNWQAIAEKSEYYPVTFMAPFNPEAKEILGLDVSSVPFLARALEQSITTGKVVASKPFELAEKGRAYVLFKPLSKNKDVIASVLINTAELLKYLESQQSGSHIALHYPDYQGKWLVESLTKQSNTFGGLGRYQFEYNFEELGQPFMLAVSYPVKLSDFNLLLSAIIALFSFVIFRVVQRLQATALSLKSELNQSNLALHKSIKQKERLFANISHELRTPLTLISAPLDNLYQDSELTTAQKKLVEIAKHNGERLHSLANRIIDISSVDSKPKSIEPIVVDDIAIRLKIAFDSLLKAKGIEFDCHFNSQANINSDLSELISVLENLLTNALKYTDKSGKVSFSSQIDHGNRLNICIENTHQGLTKAQVSSMFERFERLNVSDSQKGFGLGLALVKEICDSNNWLIECTSEQGYVRFTLSIEKWQPIADNHSPADRQLSTIEKTTSRKSKSLNSILVVEDNTELRDFLVELFSVSYQVFQADNGKLGAELAEQHVPDLIVSDLMMPELSGFELVEQLATKDSTSHIPLILLTAKADEQTKLKGLELGAVDYITKPFVAKELIFKIDNILSRRSQVAKKNAEQAALMDETKSIEVVSERDKAFCQRLENILAKHYLDHSFNVEELVSKVALSERQLQRKLKAIYEQTPAEFIRSYRLNKAKELLLEGKSISLTSDLVGFNSSSYFSRSFKTAFGLSPKEFITQSSK